MYPLTKKRKELFNNWQAIKIVVVDPSPEILNVLIAACSKSFKITFPALVENSKDLINNEPLVINLISCFSLAIIPFLPVGPSVILIQSSIS